MKDDQADKSYSNPECSSKQSSAEFESLIHQVCPIFKSFKCLMIFKREEFFIHTGASRNPQVMVSSLVTQSQTLGKAALT